LYGYDEDALKAVYKEFGLQEADTARAATATTGAQP
jgi:hypothetical protein